MQHDAVRRAMDVAAGLAMLPAAVPLAMLRRGSAALYVGQGRRRFLAYRLPDGRVPLPLWSFNLLRGDVSLVGPRPLPQTDLDAVPPESSSRFDVRPGLISLWQVRRATNIDFTTEWQTDDAYVRSRSLRGDVGLLLRAMAVSCYGQRREDRVTDTVRIMGIEIDNVTIPDVVQTIMHRLECTPSEDVLKIFFLNADCVNLAARDVEYFQTLSNASLLLPDGIGIKLAGRLLGQEIRQNVNGTDLFPALCQALDRTPHPVYLLGGTQETLGALTWRLQHTWPALPVVGAHDGFFRAEDSHLVVESIVQSKATVLLVGMGAPRQELWIARHAAATGVKVVLAVGGLFDFYSGRIPRAPQWLRELGLEWSWRLAQEPRRLWRRYLLGNAAFLARVLAQRRIVGRSSDVPGRKPAHTVQPVMDETRTEVPQ